MALDSPSQPDDTVPEHGHTSDARVVLLLSDPGNRRVVGDWLRSQYEVVTGEEIAEALAEGTVDLCILDSASFDQYRDALDAAKTAQEPCILPYLLFRKKESPRHTQTAQQYIDDVIVTPTSKRELAWRIDSLLRQRELSMTLNQKREQLEYLIGAAAHDLRNPLNVAQGYAEQLEDGATGERITNALTRMEHLVENLLTVHRTQQEITPEDQDSIAFPVLIQECQAMIPSTNATVEVVNADTAHIQAVPDLVRQLVENLLQNAIRHGGAETQIRAGILPTQDGFYIADNGPGIPADDREVVFDEGYSTNEGTGLGLAIVQRVCDAHGWQIRITESHAGGARFEIRGVGITGAENEG